MMPPFPDTTVLRGELFDDFRRLLTLLKKDGFRADPTLGDFRRLILVARDEVDLAGSPAVLSLLNKYARYPVTEVTKGITRAARRVCRIMNYGSPFTGILVGPNLVLTTAHDFRAIDGGLPFAVNVEVFFDDFRFKDGTVYCVRVLPEPDGTGRVVAAASSLPDDFDYVLFRLLDMIGTNPTGDGRKRRGWMDGSRVDVAPEGKVIVLQHPKNAFLQWADGEVAATQPPRRRAGHYEYDTDTATGSSGGAVMNEARQLVGMHNRFERTPNEGDGEMEHLVSFQAIVGDMEQRFGVRLPRYPPHAESIRLLMELTADPTLAEAFEV